MTRQLTISFGDPDPHDHPGGDLPAPDAPDSLPPLVHLGGLDVYRDAGRTVLRKPGEDRWSATVRTGPTSHRFVAAGADPLQLWHLAARARLPG